jgi:hypothetical protein
MSAMDLFIKKKYWRNGNRRSQEEGFPIAGL